VVLRRVRLEIDPSLIADRPANPDENPDF
jgi:hypothetical protein